MKPAPFTYHDPTTADEAVALLATHEDAKILAGGQSLMPMLNMRFVVPDHVIDLNRIEGIAGVRDGGDSIEIGAMTRQRDLMQDPVIAEKAPIIPDAFALGWPFPDPQPGHHRWQPVSPRPRRGAALPDGAV